MRRRAQWTLVLALAIAGFESEAHTAPARRGTTVSRTLEKHLALTRTATELRRGLTALERERGSLGHARRLLTHRGDESVRRLDAYRASKGARERQSRRRARTLYKLARGGMLRLMFEDVGGEASANRITRGRTMHWLLKHDLRELEVHRRAEKRAAQELIAASRELSALSAIRMIHSLEGRALQTLEDDLKPTVLASHYATKKVVRRRGATRSFEKKLLAQADKEWYRLKRERGLDLLERGRLVRPVAGRVVGKFGAYRDRVLRVPMSRNGIELRASLREHVRAIAAGTVEFVGTLPGFDHVVVIDHGGGFYSLTGRLMNISVAQGDTLRKGRRIGIAAPKTHADGLGLTVYLELRHGERPIDPRGYLMKTALSP